MPGYKLSSKATQDLSEYYVYGITNFGLKPAQDYFNNLHLKLEDLLRRKEFWRSAFYIKNGLYKFRFKSHMIFF